VKTKVLYLTQTEATLKARLGFHHSGGMTIYLPKVVVEAMDLKAGDEIVVSISK